MQIFHHLLLDFIPQKHFWRSWTKVFSFSSLIQVFFLFVFVFTAVALWDKNHLIYFLRTSPYSTSISSRWTFFLLSKCDDFSTRIVSNVSRKKQCWAIDNLQPFVVLAKREFTSFSSFLSVVFFFLREKTKEFSFLFLFFWRPKDRKLKWNWLSTLLMETHINSRYVLNAAVKGNQSEAKAWYPDLPKTNDSKKANIGHESGSGRDWFFNPHATGLFLFFAFCLPLFDLLGNLLNFLFPQFFIPSRWNWKCNLKEYKIPWQPWKCFIRKLNKMTKSLKPFALPFFCFFWRCEQKVSMCQVRRKFTQK